MNVDTRTVTADVVVIGAGAAGLAAARALLDRGLDVLLLEAQGRAGGRAYTLRTSDGAYPVELGAEFIHGRADATMALLRECNEGTLELPEDGIPGVWEATQRVLERVDPHAQDASVDAFLRSANSEDAAQARMLVEGFDAAIAADASILAIAEEWRGDGNDTQLRPADGYGAIVEHLARCAGDRLWRGMRVYEVRWSATGVEVRAVRDGDPVIVRARHAVVTLPIGVLHGSDVTFIPALPRDKRGAIDAIGMGPVTKVVLEFRSVFWNGAFLQTARDAAFPTVWSRFPQRAPVLVAWAGGDAANRLAARGVDPVTAAVDTCVRLFPQVNVKAEFVRAYHHDWQRDPYARGAYSYLRVNGGDARDRLARPIGQTLYFAGEATCAQDAGTVAGALESGYRAAAQVLGISGR
ncbi:MAG TPA: NAD(P)/FAD-dependent oxidoreductase [Candidatus Baltobacteraceae bacterium]|nr:NAD(P)/FAD-dependent oxidoreductase [Candidatus Baltobacteraceae bacterium]